MEVHRNNVEVVDFAKKIIRLSKKRKTSGDEIGLAETTNNGSGKRKIKDICSSGSGSGKTSQNEGHRNLSNQLIFDYTIDSHDYTDNELIDMAMEMLDYYSVYEALSTTAPMLRSFMISVRRLYTSANEFHNFKHAWAVMQSVFHILVSGADVYFNRLDIFIVLISALCHDLGHPGNNNDFEKATKSDIFKHHAQSHLTQEGILECHHGSLTQVLLSSEDHNVMGGLDDKTRVLTLARIGHVIMGTDMGIHNDVEMDLTKFVSEAMTPAKDTTAAVALFSAAAVIMVSHRYTATEGMSTTRASRNGTPAATSNGSSSGGGISMRLRARSRPLSPPIPPTTVDTASPPLSCEARDNLMRCILHSADIGAQTGYLPLAQKWMDRAYAEFHDQAVREDALHIYTSIFIHRASDELHKYQSQCFFIENVVEPLWKSLKTVFPLLQRDYEQLLQNKAAYRQRVVEMSQTATSGEARM